MRILITGLHGFVGSNLVNWLCVENEIYGLDILSPTKSGVICTYSWDQLCAIPEVDVIIHLSGKAHDIKNSSETDNYFEVNTGLTQKIYDYFLSSKAEKFIFFSSVKAVADVVIGEVLTENVTPAPKGPYGESKLAAENYIMSKPANGKMVYIMRPCMIHGLGNKGNLNLLFNIVQKGFPWPLGAFHNSRSFMSIDNVCYAIACLLKRNAPSGIYNMADDEALSTNEIVWIASQTLGKTARIWNCNRFFILMCAQLGTILHLPLNAERLQKLTQNYIVSNEKLKCALGIEKMPVSARNGMIKTLYSINQQK